MSDFVPSNDLNVLNQGQKSTANATSIPLANGGTFIGGAEQNQYPGVIVVCYTDKECTLYIDLSIDGTNWDSSISFTVSANINEVHRVVKGGRYVRIRITNNSGSAQTYLRADTYYGNFPQLTSALNSQIQQDADTSVVRNISDQTSIAEGKFANYSIVNKAGYNPDVDTGSVPEDVWGGGGLYSGFPSTLGETITVVSTSANDASGGTGARTLRIIGLDANYEVQNEEFTLNGLTPVTGVKTFTRVHTATVLTSGASNANFNDGVISVYHTTTTANVFLNMRVGTNQSNSSGYTVPANHTAYIRQVDTAVGSGGGNTAAIDYSLWVQPATKTAAPRLRRPNSAYYGNLSQDEIFGGLVVTEKTDIIIRVTRCSANNTPVSGGYDLILVKN